jgi:hypothetical protein
MFFSDDFQIMRGQGKKVNVGINRKIICLMYLSDKKTDFEIDKYLSVF